MGQGDLRSLPRPEEDDEQEDVVGDEFPPFPVGTKAIARAFGCSPRWMQRHAHELPVHELPGGSHVASVKELDAYVRRLPRVKPNKG